MKAAFYAIGPVNRSGPILQLLGPAQGKRWTVNLIFDTQNIYVKCVYQGYWVRVKVTGEKVIQA